MKKLLSILMGIAVSALLLVSCEQLTGNGLITPSGEKPIINSSEFTVSVDSLLASRNIMPDEWTPDSAENLKYVLTGGTSADWTVNEVSADTNGKVFAYSEIVAGTAKIALKPVQWWFVLTVYQDDAHTKVALISDKVAVNLTTGNATGNFVLKAPASTEATGSVSVKVKFPKPANFDSVTYGIYQGNTVNAAPITSKLDEPEPATYATEYKATVTADSIKLTKENETGDYSFIYTNGSVKAGRNYYFNAIFRDSANNIIAFYSDILVVDGANTSSKEIELGNIFNTPALNPTSLAVAYSYNDAGMKAVNLTDEQTVPNSYKATFTWNDKANNETGYELVLTNVADAAEVLTYTSSSTVEAGSLGASSTSVTVSLNTGKEYTAKIRAVNSFTTVTEYFDMTGSVNLFTVTYTLVGGLVKTDTSNVTADTVVRYVVPYNKSSVEQTLLSSESNSYPFIYKTGYNFVRWYESSDTVDMAAVTEIAADNVANIELTAYWESSVGVTLEFPSYEGIKQLALVPSQADGSVVTIAGAPTGEATTTVVTLTPNSTLENVTWTVYDTDYVTKIEDNIVIDAETKKLTWTITDTVNDIEVLSGTYRVAINATYNDSPVVGNVYITITR